MAGHEDVPKRRRKAVIIAIAAALGATVMLVRAIYRPFKVPSEAMQPTLLSGDHIFANMMDDELGKLGRGDLIVLRYPLDPSADFVKRMIGLPGDEVILAGQSVAIRRPGESTATPLERERSDADCVGGLAPDFCTRYEETLDGHRYEVQYLQSQQRREGVERRVFEVPEGHVFVLGDNRNQSHDSSQWSRRGPNGEDVPAPFLPVDHIKGRVTRIWLPFDRARAF